VTTMQYTGQLVWVYNC